jgi:CBS domain-containing protein
MRGKRVTIYLGDSDRWGLAPLHLAILERLRAAGCRGATVTRGVAGFGAHSHIKTASLVELSADLPIVITLVDLPERVDAVLPEIVGMLAGGTVTVDDTEVHFSSAAFAGGLPNLRVAQVMSTDVDAVEPDTPVGDVVERLLARDYTALPVVDGRRRVVGVVSDGDLLASGLTAASLSLHKALGPDGLRDMVARLKHERRRTGEVMTTPAVTIGRDGSLKDAARLMHERGLKRLPVVDEDGVLAGVIGRLDVLSAVVSGYAGRMVPAAARLPQEHRTVGEIMERDVPTVPEMAPLTDVVERLLASRVKRVVVVDDRMRAVGIVTDTDVLARAEASERPGLLTLLRSRWSEDARRELRRIYGRRASDVMSSPVVSIADTAPVIDALTLVVTRHVKRLPVTGADGRVVGIVSRPALLAASLDLST